MLYIIRFFEPGSLPHFAKHENVIISNIEGKLGPITVTKDRGRLYIETGNGNATSLLKTIQGISSFSEAIKCTMAELTDKVLDIAQRTLKGKKAFGVKVRRSGEHVESSQEVGAYLGENILERLPNLNVDLTSPEAWIFVEINGDDCYIYTEMVKPEVPPPPQEISAEPKFIADDMVGKLAKRLRILGYDTAYMSGAADIEYYDKARSEGRILLTRDTLLSQKTGIKTLLIRSTAIEEQLKQVVSELKLKPDPSKMFLRCSVDNNPIEPIDKAKVKDKVPERVYKEYNKFHVCPVCKRIYWKGSHYERLIKEFEDLI